MNSFDYSFNRSIESAYVITVINNDSSRMMAQRAIQSCNSVGMPVKLWPAVSVKKEGEFNKLVYPDQITEDNIVRYIKRLNTYLTATEIACALSHISLWFHCIKIDRPIIILEHDAIMVKKLENHNFYNAIHYLGCNIYKTGQFEMTPIPLNGFWDTNHRFMYCAHAYAIDPQIAKNMLACVLQNGLTHSLDVFLRSDIFSIQHDQQIYAYEIMGETTITNRNEDNPRENKDLRY